ncbi:MAG TPA: M4 family metallopeptidase, partial [Candidatus Hydrogenedentes bacterium]|nr:M4 family metallopeptidase [Candidatus Hydrogenedentota bacterium]
MIPRMQAHATLLRPVFAICAVLILVCAAGRADTERVADPDAISALIHALDGSEAAEFPLVYRDKGGFVQFLAAPPQARFKVPSSTAKAVMTPETVAQEFLNHHCDAFGLAAEAVELRFSRVVTRGGGAFVRLDQYYSGLQVFGGQVIVYLDEGLNVLNVNADVLRDTAALEKTYDALTPVLTAVQAVEQAIAHNASVLETESERFSAAGDPEQVIFEPKLLSMAGNACLAWKVRLNDSKSMEDITVLIHAGDGSMLLRFAEQAAARRREIYDTEQGTDLINAKMVRKEGDPPVREEDYENAEYINTAFDYFGDCYDFYMNYHGRDSYDNAGSIIRAYVNYPMLNAYWDNQQHIMVIGNLFLSDDVLAHEFTHGVTSVDSDLIYYSYAGAITEMYSDLGGEFVDLTNGRGDDSPEMRWYLGEDMEFKLSDIRGLDSEDEEGEKTLSQNKEELPGIRYMKDPTVFEEPDRLGSPFLWNPFSYSDLGGVHSNCGVGNKLIYLLTGGDTFNNQSVKGMGIPKVADLFYAARPMLSPTADYFELYHALLAASVLLNFTAEERANIIAGARAVEIEPPDVQVASIQGLRNFRALPTS